MKSSTILMYNINVYSYILLHVHVQCSKPVNRLYTTYVCVCMYVRRLILFCFRVRLYGTVYGVHVRSRSCSRSCFCSRRVKCLPLPRHNQETKNAKSKAKNKVKKEKK